MSILGELRPLERVETYGGEVTLRGTVRSFVELKEAERVAWELAGITHVQNDIRVGS